MRKITARMSHLRAHHKRTITLRRIQRVIILVILLSLIEHAQRLNLRNDGGGVQLLSTRHRTLKRLTLQALKRPYIQTE